MRIGQGWDIHRLEKGLKLILGGVEIPSETGTIAHSDGDALAHAIIDAVLGAAAAGDIGTHFPDTSPEWKNADSMKLLAEAVNIAADAGMKPVNIDSTIILQTPKLKPFIEPMRRNIAAAAGLELSAVSVKAKTNEGLGETGAGKAVETQAAVLLEKAVTPDWPDIFRLLKQFISDNTLPSVSQIAEDNADPYRVLFSTIISLRTRDEVTLAASRRLFKHAPDIHALLVTDESRIAELIYPAAFYHNKAASIKKCAYIILNEYDGLIPSERDELLKLPGVGRKTANLTLNLGFGINAICVDTHVHRISNRAGWVNTKTPDDTELAMEKVLPEKYWIPLNEILVSYGQSICTPQSPHCSKCVITKHCGRVGVTRSR